MKKTVKTIIRIPMSIFWYIKNRYFYNKINLLGEHSNIIVSLKESGYCVIGKSYGDVQFESIKKDINEIISKHDLEKPGQDKGRVNNPHLFSKNILIYAEYLKKIAYEYFANENIDIEMSLYQKSLPVSDIHDIPGGEGFHIDDGRKILKFFLYLTDVSEINGPFCYVPKSNGLSGWLKFKRIINWNIFLSHFTLYFDESDIKQTDRVLVCADKGTLFCADTTGFHKATPVQSGSREILVVSFNEKRFDLLPKRTLTTQML